VQSGGHTTGRLKELLSSHRGAPHIGVAFELDDVAAALRYVVDRRAIGEVVLDITSTRRSDPRAQRLVGNPRSITLVAGSGQRVVTTLGRVQKRMPSGP
jgi:hypothetical protein